MFNSFQGDVLRGYREWVASAFRNPTVPSTARDYLLHLTAQAVGGRCEGLWAHQREAVTRTIYANEVLRSNDGGWRDVLINMATGTGKTAVIGALMAYLRIVHEIRTFLLLSPNTIVRERLSSDFEQSNKVNNVWRRFGLFPPEFAHYANDMNVYVLKSGASAAGIRGASVIVSNVHQLYDTNQRGEENFGVLVRQSGKIAVFNDEAHNTVAPKYDEMLERLSRLEKTFFRVDTTATPDRADGQNPYSRMLFEYGIREALRDNLIKSVFVCQPKIESVELTYTDTETGAIVRVEDVPWEDIDSRKIPATKWVTTEKPLRQQLEMAVRRLAEQRARANGRYKPILFVVAVSIRDAHNARDVLEEVFGLKAFVVASRDADGADLEKEERERELRAAMVLGTPADTDEYDAVVSVLMLREGWDVRSVSVIALLRKFSSPVYGHQVIGRGLRRVFANDRETRESLVVVDHPKLDHGWLWEQIDAYVKTGVGQRQSLDLQLPERETVTPEDGLGDSPVAAEQLPDGIEEIILPDPAEFDDAPLEGDWREYLDQVRYPAHVVTISNVEHVGEIERDLAGSGAVRELPYESRSPDPMARPAPPESHDRLSELTEQLFDLTVELLFNNGLPMSGRSTVYGVLLDHISKKLLGGLTLGHADGSRLRMVQDALHHVRPVFDRREVLRAILRDPPDL